MVGVRRRASRGEFRVGESEGGERRRWEQEVELEVTSWPGACELGPSRLLLERDFSFHLGGWEPTSGYLGGQGLEGLNLQLDRLSSKSSFPLLLPPKLKVLGLSQASAA